MNKIKIALAGNPNVGKTSLFNAITSSAERVGNWHGVTVEQKQKTVFFEDTQVTVVDLPGFYSMSTYSYEEEISRNAILFGENDVVVSVCEAGNLARNLYLALQLIEAGACVVVAVNMIDELQKKGLILDEERLSRALGVPVITVTSKRPEDIKRLMTFAIKHAGVRQKRADYLRDLPITEVVDLINPYVGDVNFNIEFLAIKLLEGDACAQKILDLPQSIRDRLSLYGDFSSKVAEARYGFIYKALDGVIARSPENKRHKRKNPLTKAVYATHSLSKFDIYDKESFLQSALDKIVLNRYLSLPIFLLVIASVFFVVFGSFGNFLSSLIEKYLINHLYFWANNAMQSANLPEYLVSLVCDGIVLGIGGVVGFLPQVALLFAFLTVLEESGYISRLAFVTDGFFSKIGLSGRAVFTMLMGLGCSATAVLTARGLSNAKMRKKAVLVTPFMSCSARLPIYATIFSAFFVKNKPFLILFLYLLGCAVALFWAVIFENTKVLKSNESLFIMEMPPYRIPQLRSVMSALMENIKSFLTKIATVVFAMSVIIWILSNFSLGSGFIVPGDNSKSILSVLASMLAPVFAPLGFGDWKCVAALFSGLVAKESVVSVIKSFGGVTDIFVGANADITALCFAVFSVLYLPCIATMSVISKEIGAKWAVFSIFLHACSAYAVTLVVRVICLLLRYYNTLTISTLLVLLVVVLMVKSIIYITRKRRKACCRCERCNGLCG